MRMRSATASATRQHPTSPSPLPPSRGRYFYTPFWLAELLRPSTGLSPADVQATLTEFTAQACAMDVQRFAPQAQSLIVCGGGALNGHLMQRLGLSLPGVVVISSEAKGLPPLQVEAAAFAWLAFKAIRRETASLKSVTGAQGARVLGAIYPR